MSSISQILKTCAGLCCVAVAIACAACATAPESEPAGPPQAFYTVTAEIALSRHEMRTAALEYTAAVQYVRDAGSLEHAAEVTEVCLQPSLTADIAARWLAFDPKSVGAQRAAGQAALDLQQIERSAMHYRAAVAASPDGAEQELTRLETELTDSDNVYGARQLADKLAVSYPGSAAARRIQAFAALRADDPRAAAEDFAAALAAAANDEARHELTLSRWRAQVLAGDIDEPLRLAKVQLGDSAKAADRVDYALLLLAAHHNEEARGVLAAAAQNPDADSKAVALRLLGLLDYQSGRFDDAAQHFAQLLGSGKLVDDALYYLGMIAERHQDFERALRLYAQVQNGTNALPALLRAAAILRAHGASPAAEALLDRLTDEDPLRAPEILSSRARIYSDAGDYARAQAVLKRGEAEYPDSVELKYAAASLAESEGQVGIALRELKAVLAARPDDPAAINAYGYTLADHNRSLRLARKLIEQAHAAAPASAAIDDSLGWVLFRQGRGPEALRYLDIAYADDHSADIAAHLGEVLWRLGRQADAEQIWAEGERSELDNALLKSTQRRLHAVN